MTLQFGVSTQIRNVGYVKAMVQKNFPGLGYDDTPVWRMTRDARGVVVDVAQDKVEVKRDTHGQEYIVLAGKAWSERGVTLQVCTALPELQERPPVDSWGSSRGGSWGARGGRGALRGKMGARGGRFSGASRGSFGTRGH